MRERLRSSAQGKSSGVVTKESLLAAFERADLNGDGALSRREFGDALDRLGLGLSQFELERVTEKADADGSGTVDYAEFAALVLPAEGTAEAEGTGGDGNGGRRVAAQWLAQARADGRDPRGHVTALPRNASGRITRRALRHAAADMGLKMSEAQWRGVLDGARETRGKKGISRLLTRQARVQTWIRRGRAPCPPRSSCRRARELVRCRRLRRRRSASA